MYTIITANGHTEVLRCLLEEKSAKEVLEKRDSRGTTPAHDAAENGHVICLKLLIDAGLNVHQKDEV